MEDILIQSEYSKPTGKATFSKLAFVFSIATIVLFTVMVVVAALTASSYGGSITFLKIFSWIIFLSMVLGLVFSIISLVKKEKLKYFKVIAIILNFGFFILVIAAAVISFE